MDLTNRRVKVYLLTSDSAWDDQGTGIVSWEFQRGAPCFVVNSETDNKVIASARILEQPFERQGETIILWTNAETNLDHALSFQESEGASEFWERLCEVQGEHEANSQPVGAFVLPEPDLKNIGDYARMISECTMMQRESVANIILEQQHLGMLFDLFRICDDLEDPEGLDAICRAFRAIAALNEIAVIEILLSDKYFLDFAGALEYDVELPVQSRIKHRDYLTRRVEFKQLIRFKDEGIVKKVHENFRIAYMKDVMLATALDEIGFALLNQMITMNNADIMSYIQSDRGFLSKLFDAIKDRRTPKSQLVDYWRLLQELCTVAKTQDLQLRNNLYRSLCTAGLFEVAARILKEGNPTLRNAGCEILNTTLIHDPDLLRKFVCDQGPSSELLMALIRTALHDADSGIRLLVVEVIKHLFDIDMTIDDASQSTLLNILYGPPMEALLAPLNSAATIAQTEEESLLNICDILSFCVERHGHQIKYLVLRQTVIQKVTALLKSKQKAIALGAVRFLRSCVGISGEFYHRYIIKNNLLAPLVQLLKKHKHRNSLLSSAIFDVFEFIRRENVTTLGQYAVDNFKDVLLSVSGVHVFVQLVQQYDPSAIVEVSSSTTPAKPAATPSTPPPPPSPEPEETAKLDAAPALALLVDYGDDGSDEDDDDDADGSSPKKQRIS